MSLFGPYSVVSDATTHDPLGYKIVTGTFDFVDDHMQGKKWYLAIKGSPNAHGSIKADPGTITGFTVTNGGTGYTSAPTVVFTGGGGTGAAATATVSSAGVVTGITLTAAGSGYTSAPTISYSGGGGTGLAATLAFTGGKAHVDATAARAFPGVKGVYWYEQFSGTYGYASSWTNYGVAVAGVVAEDWETARYACSLIKIEYNDPLPVVYDADVAISPSSPLSGRQTTGNVTSSTTTRPTTSTYPTGTYTDTAAFANAEVTYGSGVGDDKTSPLYLPWTTTFQHNPVHPKTGLAYFIGDDCYGYCSSQNGMAGRAPMATALGAPLHKCHVQIHGCGGGMGDGYTEPHMAIAARHSKDLGGHAITYKLSRQGHNHIGTRQYDTRASYKIGAKKDGTIVAWTGIQYGVTSAPSLYGLQKTYTIPNMSVTSVGVYTNTPARGAWRCVGDPPGSFNFDGAIDRLATYLGLDPWAVRMKNFMPPDMPDQDTAVDSFGRPRYWSSKGVNASVAVLYPDCGYASKWHQPGTKTLADGRMHGIAITMRQDSHGGVSGATRYGHLRRGGQDNTGKLFVYTGGSRGSSGACAICVHISAEVLGLLYSDCCLAEFANSDINLDTGSQGGSAWTGGAGSGFYNAALLMRKMLFERACTLAPFATITPANVTTKATATATLNANGGVAFITVTNGGAGYSGPPSVTLTGSGGTTATAIASIDATGKVIGIQVTNPGNAYTAPPTVNIYSVTPADLDAKNSSIFLVSDPTKTITHATVSSGMTPYIAVAGGWAGNFRAVPATGMPGTGALQAKVGDACMVTGSCSTCCEVAVDTDTGVVEVTGIWNYIHTGTSIFKTGALKEIGSGAEQIIGQVLFFGDVYDPVTAAVLQVSHGSFSQVTTMDFSPASFHLKDVETNDVAAPCGGRGIAEPCLGDVSALNNAIFNAIGKWVDPEHGAMTPDKVLKALGKA